MAVLAEDLVTAAGLGLHEIVDALLSKKLVDPLKKLQSLGGPPGNVALFEAASHGHDRLFFCVYFFSDFLFVGFLREIRQINSRFLSKEGGGGHAAWGGGGGAREAAVKRS